MTARIDSDSWRLEEAGTVTRFLNVLQTADGAAPTFTAQRIVSDTTQMEGALWQDQQVVRVQGSGTAGLARQLVKSFRREPLPPARINATVFFVSALTKREDDKSCCIFASPDL